MVGGRGIFSEKLIGKKVKFKLGDGEKIGEIHSMSAMGDGGRLLFHLIYDKVKFFTAYADACTLTQSLEDEECIV